MSRSGAGLAALALLLALPAGTGRAAEPEPAGELSLPARRGRAAEEPLAPFHYNTHGRRDPFVPLVRDGRLVSVQGMFAEATRPVLYGILWDPGGASLALINDAEVKVGDVIGTYRVAEIRPDAVVLNNGGAPVVLQISYDVPPKTGGPKGGEGP